MVTTPPDPPVPGQMSALAADTRRRLLLLTALGALLVVGLVAATARLTDHFGDHLGEAARLQSVADDIEELTRVIVDLETAQRGYIITGDSHYLEPYHAGVARLDGMLDTIARGVADDRVARAEFESLRTLLVEKRSEIDMSIALMNEQGFDAAKRYVGGNFGMALMDAARSNFQQLKRRFETRAAAATSAGSALREQRDASFIALGFLCLAAALGAIAVLYRYTRVLESEAQAVAAARRAARESVEKGRFLANMSHEIRTPMNAIFGFTQLLGELVTGAKERYYVQAIAQSGSVLLALINDVLDLSKIEAGKLELNLQPVELRDTLTQVRTMFSQMAASKGLRLDVDVDAGVPTALLLDPLRLRQVLLNLVGNALKFTTRGQVQIHASAEALAEQRWQLVVEVRDSGAGIAPEQQQRIFEPFTQLGHGIDAGGGSGLGLSIVRQLVDLMGGRISLSSELGVGSTFRIELPTRAPMAGDTGNAAMPASLAELRPLTVVAIDDVELNCALVRGFFDGTPHRVLTAHDAESGLALVREHRPDVVLMDIRMPGIDGIGALHMIRSESMLVGVKVIASTASSMNSEEGQLRRLFDGFVRKPMTREQLFAEIARLVAAPGTADAAPTPLAATDISRHAGTFKRVMARLEQAEQTLSSDHVEQLLRTLAVLPDEPALQPLHGLRQQLQQANAVYDIVRIEAMLLALRAHIAAPTLPVDAETARNAE